MTSIELDIWKGDWGLASVDLDCLRVLTYVKFIGVPVKVRETNSPFFAPKGCLPVLRDGRKVFTDFDNIVEYLKSLPSKEYNGKKVSHVTIGLTAHEGRRKLHEERIIAKLEGKRAYLKTIFGGENLPAAFANFNTDISLTSKQQLEVGAFTQYLKEKLYPAIQYAWWVDEKNYNDMTRPSYGKALSFPFNFYYPPKYHSQAREMIDAIYGESHNDREIEHVVYGEAEKCLKDLSDKLGESEYFFGTRPSTFDATVFAYLAPILKAPFPNPTLQCKLKSIANLSRFVARISQKNFRLISDEYASNQSKNKSSTGTQSDKDLAHFPNQIRNKILAALFAAIAMGGYAFSNGLFQDRMNGALMNVIKNKQISKEARLAVHNGVLVPTVMYGSESWILYKNTESMMNAVEMRSLRSICGRTLRNRVNFKDHFDHSHEYNDLFENEEDDN